MQRLKTLVILVLAFCAAILPIPIWAERQANSSQIGARDHPHMLAQFGGAISDAKLSDYVSRLGLQLVSQTDESQEKWTFTVLDSPVVNAFALPGGYVYVTRGLLAIANNEAELSAVLGHEIGHVISGHGEERIKQNNRVGIGVVLGTILGGVFGGQDGAADAIDLGAKLATGYLAQHSQSQELEADLIGIRLLAETGYSPFAQADFLQQLAAKEALELQISGQQYNPNRVDFFASHPATEKRTKKAVSEARKYGPANGQGSLKEKQYLSQIDGIIYGDTAREGFIRGLTFSHPELKFTFSVPAGFILMNFSNHVEAGNKSGAKIILSGEAFWPRGMDQFIREKWIPAIGQEFPVTDFHDLRLLKINGLPAATATANITVKEGPRIAQFTAIRFEDTTIRIVTLSKKSDGKSRNALNTASQSFRRLLAHEAAALSPYHLRVDTVGAGDNVRKLSASMPLTGFGEAQFKSMNGYGPGEPMKIGDLVKIVE
jgi:predicted Zn-dependent protease